MQAAQDGQGRAGQYRQTPTGRAGQAGRYRQRMGRAGQGGTGRGWAGQGRTGSALCRFLRALTAAPSPECEAIHTGDTDWGREGSRSGSPPRAGSQHHGYGGTAWAVPELLEGKPELVLQARRSGCLTTVGRSGGSASLLDPEEPRPRNYYNRLETKPEALSTWLP